MKLKFNWFTRLSIHIIIIIIFSGRSETERPERQGQDQQRNLPDYTFKSSATALCL